MILPQTPSCSQTLFREKKGRSAVGPSAGGTAAAGAAPIPDTLSPPCGFRRVLFLVPRVLPAPALPPFLHGLFSSRAGLGEDLPEAR